MSWYTYIHGGWTQTPTGLVPTTPSASTGSSSTVSTWPILRAVAGLIVSIFFLVVSNVILELGPRPGYCGSEPWPAGGSTKVTSLPTLWDTAARTAGVSSPATDPAFQVGISMLFINTPKDDNRLTEPPRGVRDPEKEVPSFVDSSKRFVCKPHF